jgi:hypothetical protein
MAVILGILAVVVVMIVGIIGIWAAAIRSKRAEMLPVVAAQAGLGYSEFDLFNTAAVPFPLFREGEGRKITNLLWRDAPGTPRVFDYGYYTIYKDKNGGEYRRWQWFACALVQHNGKWPTLRVTRERLLDRAAQTLGLPDIELESEEFNRTYLVQCEDPKFATDLLDPQMMEFVLGTKGLVDIQTKGRFLLVTTNQVETAEAMVGLLGVAEGIVARVPPLVWDLYGRFPDGMGTQDMPPPPSKLRADDVGLLGHPRAGGVVPYDFSPVPRLDRIGDAWDPTPGIEHDLDGREIEAVDEDPWGEGRTRAP